MQWNYVINSIIVSIIASSIFWLMTFVISGTKIIFSEIIEKSYIESPNGSDALYRLRLMNIGFRDLVEVTTTAKISIKINYLNYEATRTSFLCLGEDKVYPLMSGRGKKKNNHFFRANVLGFYVDEVTRKEFVKPYYSERIRKEAEK